MRAVRVIALSAVFVAGLWFTAWWSVPIVGAVYALVWQRRGASFEAMLGAFIATVVLLARQALGPSFGVLLTALGTIFPVPGVAVAGITVLLMVLLAYCGARVMAGLVGVREMPRQRGV